MSEAFPIPDAALDDRLGFVGTSGSGKTYNAGAAVERLLQSGARVVIVDPLDVWWGLRLDAAGNGKGFDLPIFGGAHGDLPLNERAGKILGETVAATSQSCIVSLGGLPTKEAERHFMLNFLEALYRKAGGDPFHVIFDEADLWAPQRSTTGAGPKLQSLMEQIVRRGRVKGFIPWLISQRPAVISKDVLSQVDGLVVFKLTSSHDRDAIGDWVKGQADLDEWKRIWASLPAMQQGEGVVWVPARNVLASVRFPAKLTFDSSRAPRRGEKRERRDLKPLDMGALKVRMAAIEDEAKANDPAALKAENARLTKALNQALRQIKEPPAPEQIVANAAEIEAARADGERVGIAIGITRARQALAALGVDGPSVRFLPIERPARAAQPKPEIVADGSVPAGCARPLAALASVYPAGLTEPQWATTAGYKRSGGTWGTYKSRLRGAGLIESREGRWFATEEGARAAGDVEMPPPPGPELVRWWAAKLPGTARMAEALIEAGRDGLPREELAARLEMSASGGSFGTYLSRLAGPGLIERSDGIVRLSADVFPERAA